MEVSRLCSTKCSILDHGKRSVNRMVWKGVKGVYTAMINDPVKEWDRVHTFCALLVDLGRHRDL